MMALWEGEYTYRCILTNDHESSDREIVELYNAYADVFLNDFG